jgi:repressor LexA
MSEQLSSIEENVYHYLLDYLDENSFQPSVREIGKKFQIKSTKTVSEILHALEKKGYVERHPSRSRALKLIGHTAVRETVPVPYYGKIAAGPPELLPEHRKGAITMDRRFVPRDDSYFLKVDGDSMIGCGINDGDFVLIAPEKDISEGTIVAARIGDSATVKTFTRRDSMIVLVPANPAEKEIVIRHDDDFSLLGRVCAVVRAIEKTG